jgi:hypothetical protein
MTPTAANPARSLSAAHRPSVVMSAPGTAAGSPIPILIAALQSSVMSRPGHRAAGSPWAVAVAVAMTAPSGSESTASRNPGPVGVDDPAPADEPAGPDRPQEAHVPLESRLELVGLPASPAAPAPALRPRPRTARTGRASQLLCRSPTTCPDQARSKPRHDTVLNGIDLGPSLAGATDPRENDDRLTSTGR